MLTASSLELLDFDSPAETAEVEYLSRVADSGMALTVRLIQDFDGLAVVVSTANGDYFERREVSPARALDSFHHPFALFPDMPSPWTRGASIGCDADDETDETDETETDETEGLENV